MIAVRNDRITVIGTAYDEIQFIAATWTHFDIPQTAVGIEREPERIAVTERPDMRSDTAFARKRVIGWYGAIIIQPQNLAEIRFHLLGRIKLLTFARADPEIAVTKCNAVAIMTAAAYFRVLAP